MKEYSITKMDYDEIHDLYNEMERLISIKINGEEWVELRNKSKFAKWKGFGLNEKGHIGLQDHGDLVSFKNLKVKKLN